MISDNCERMRSAKDLLKELDYWHYIGTSDDIVKCAEQRLEYQHWVKKVEETPTS
jgi:hypothetical protein